MYEILSKVKEIVKNEANADDWNFHIQPVALYAGQLADTLHENKDTVLIAAYLHDIGRIRHGHRNHHITGLLDAETILSSLNCSIEFINTIKHAVLTHRGDPNDPPQTVLAKIIMNADALAHFDNFPHIIYELSKKYSMSETIDLAIKTLRKDWIYKLTLPDAFRHADHKPYLAFETLRLTQKHNF